MWQRNDEVRHREDRVNLKLDMRINANFLPAIRAFYNLYKEVYSAIKTRLFFCKSGVIVNYLSVLRVTFYNTENNTQSLRLASVALDCVVKNRLKQIETFSIVLVMQILKERDSYLSFT